MPPALPRQPQLSILLDHLGWNTSAGKALPLADYSVRNGTQLLLEQAGILRAHADLFIAYCCEALGPAASAEAAGQATCEWVAVLDRLWRLPWANKHGEVMWLLLHNRVPTAARMHSATCCACGAPIPGAFTTSALPALPTIALIPNRGEGGAWAKRQNTTALGVPG